jgi:hypothetical protein
VISIGANKSMAWNSIGNLEKPEGYRNFEKPQHIPGISKLHSYARMFQTQKRP